MGEGKRFCGGCGEAMAVPSISAEPTTQPGPEPATALCAACGAALAPGKRFCRQCGCAVSEPLTETEAETKAPLVAAAEPAGEVCAYCGAALAPGKRFCRKCGHTVELRTHSAEPITEERPPSPEITHAPEAPTHEPIRQPKLKIGLVVGIGCAVLAAAGGGWWYVHAHHGAASATQSTTPSQQASGQAAVATNPGITPVTDQSSKPSPSNPQNPVSTVQQPAPQQRTPLSQTAPSAIKPQEPVRSPAKPQTPLAIAPTPSNALPRSGVQHYQGPPVPYNGQVVFDHLPQERLRFTYDHQAWSLTIKSNPDGTKKVTLTSQKPGYQTSCDLGWEIVE